MVTEKALNVFYVTGTVLTNTDIIILISHIKELCLAEVKELVEGHMVNVFRRANKRHSVHAALPY